MGLEDVVEIVDDHYDFFSKCIVDELIDKSVSDIGYINDLESGHPIIALLKKGYYSIKGQLSRENLKKDNLKNLLRQIKTNIFNATTRWTETYEENQHFCIVPALILTPNSFNTNVFYPVKNISELGTFLPDSDVSGGSFFQQFDKLKRYEGCEEKLLTFFFLLETEKGVFSRRYPKLNHQIEQYKDALSKELKKDCPGYNYPDSELPRVHPTKKEKSADFYKRWVLDDFHNVLYGLPSLLMSKEDYLVSYNKGSLLTFAKQIRKSKNEISLYSVMDDFFNTIHSYEQIVKTMTFLSKFGVYNPSIGRSLRYKKMKNDFNKGMYDVTKNHFKDVVTNSLDA